MFQLDSESVVLLVEEERGVLGLLGGTIDDEPEVGEPAGDVTLGDGTVGGEPMEGGTVGGGG